MGVAFDLNCVTSTSTGAGNFIAATNYTGDTPNVKNFGQQANAQLIGFGRKGATAGTARIRSNLFHDDVQAIRVRALAADPTDHLQHYATQLMYAQDAPLIDGDGTNLEVEQYWLSYYYSDLPGAQARLHSLADVDPLIQLIVAQQVTIAAVVPPNYASAALTSLYNTLKANRDYAVLGYQVDTALGAVALQGADTSNLKVGGPGILDIYKTRDYFVRISAETGLPLIPVINAANAPATNLLVANDVAAAGANVTFFLGLLSQNLPN